MNEVKKVYDLEERTFLFAKNVRSFVKQIERSIWNKEDIKQLVRCSGSIGANYIEANDNLGEKDFLMRIRICKKETKESIYWMRLLDIENEILEIEKSILINEATELRKIFGSIYKNKTGLNN